MSSVATAQEPVRVDLLLKGGLIADGTGRPGGVGDVAIHGDQIMAVGTFDGAADRTIDCRGLIVCPGFIDLHNHSDPQIVAPETRANMNYVVQGCTTIVTGNCGFGPVDAGKLMGEVDLYRAGSNVGHLLPQGSLREDVVGLEDRKATEEEIESMRKLAQRALDDGVWGMSTGLIYVPGSYADTTEITSIAEVISGGGGVLPATCAARARNCCSRFMKC